VPANGSVNPIARSLNGVIWRLDLGLNNNNFFVVGRAARWLGPIAQRVFLVGGDVSARGITIAVSPNGRQFFPQNGTSFSVRARDFAYSSLQNLFVAVGCCNPDVLVSTDAIFWQPAFGNGNSGLFLPGGESYTVFFSSTLRRLLLGGGGGDNCLIYIVNDPTRSNWTCVAFTSGGLSRVYDLTDDTTGALYASGLRASSAGPSVMYSANGTSWTSYTPDLLPNNPESVSQLEFSEVYNAFVARAGSNLTFANAALDTLPVSASLIFPTPIAFDGHFGAFRDGRILFGAVGSLFINRSAILPPN
jgi:hypothetical protein